MTQAPEGFAVTASTAGAPVADRSIGGGPASADAALALPSAAASFTIALLPVALLAGATILTTLPTVPPVAKAWIAFGGNPVVTMLISVLAAMLILGVAVAIIVWIAARKLWNRR